MINKRTESGWEGVEEQDYKDQTGSWKAVKRFTFAQDASTGFEMRCFEIGPGGYSTLEEHEHEHCVMVLAGQGEVFLGDQWHSIGEGDFVHVPAWTIHQFKSSADQSLQFICVVDRVRDRPKNASSCDCCNH